jgi:hypothetical protein
MSRMTDDELKAEAARWTGKIHPLEGFMTRTEFKGWLMDAVMQAFMRDRASQMPITMPNIKVHVLDPAEVVVDDVMEEGGKEAFWVNVTF